ncbi:MAG: CerR family C-terminal domain-containing protein [Parvibaculum sp.]|nr:CerR family C-terminal domain-containing protein [Parvibaculum sp.]
MKQRRNTKQRLLEAAREVFAERGYHNATVRDIALRAGTNLASINYYFHSKDDLYREVMRSAFQTNNENAGATGHPDELMQGSPEDRLRAFIRRLIPSSTTQADDENNRRLMAWEMLAPTGAVKTVDEWEIRTHLDAAQTVVRPFLSTDVSSIDETQTALWLIGQCLVFRKLATGPAQDTLPEDLAMSGSEQLVDLVVSRALSGLQPDKNRPH